MSLPPQLVFPGLGLTQGARTVNNLRPCLKISDKGRRGHKHSSLKCNRINYGHKKVLLYRPRLELFIFFALLQKNLEVHDGCLS
jgi:hypothetical protein